MAWKAGRGILLAFFAVGLSGLAGCDGPITTGPDGHWQSAIRTFNVPSRSMVPTLHEGDYFLSSTRIQRDLLKRGTIIVYQSPAQADVTYVKRIIGLPGETIEIRKGRVYIDGTPFDEDVYIDPSPPDPRNTEFAPVTVPGDRLYVLGDNRNNSVDSRFAQHGLVPIGNVIAIPSLIYWSAGWGRIGMQVR